ncbi:MAG TPA: (d)CMP kinase [Solirubrobacteraceae bacterium]|nr:(d)CMP kinase [Solirubrobacteraceae bacterium]
MVIAIDGPAGAGKSTVARALARELGFAYLDSGAMYRCVALLSLEHPRAEPGQLARDAAIELESGATGAGGDAGEGGGVVRLDGRDVTAAIRSPEVSGTSSRVAADPAVREALLSKQRALLAAGDWVAEGRDIGTVVAPDAELKVFLTADPDERAQRRARQSGGDARAVLAEQRERDERDAGRVHSPLRVAAGAVEVDTTGLAVEEVVRQIAALAESAAVHRHTGLP